MYNPNTRLHVWKCNFPFFGFILVKNVSSNIPILAGRSKDLSLDCAILPRGNPSCSHAVHLKPTRQGKTKASDIMLCLLILDD